MMYGRHILQTNIFAHFGFAPHQLSGVLQARTDKPVFFVKPHGLPIEPSRLLWRVLATAPVVSTDKLSPSPPPKMDLPDVKWTAPPLPKIKALAEAPASVKHFTHSTRKRMKKSTKKLKVTKPTVKLVDENSTANLDLAKEIPQTQRSAKQTRENDAPLAVKMFRFGFDLLSGFRGPRGAMSTQDWLNRCLVLEIAAGVSGMADGVAYSHDNNWIKQIAKDAENERIHMSIFMNMKESGWLFQVAVQAAQTALFPVFMLTFMLLPRTCRRVEEFLVEEIIQTYTQLLDDMEHGHLDEWCTMDAPQIGRTYYNLPDDAKVYDMIKCIRADEANHHHGNRTTSSVRSINLFVGHH